MNKHSSTRLKKRTSYSRITDSSLDKMALDTLLASLMFLPLDDLFFNFSKVNKNFRNYLNKWETVEMIWKNLNLYPCDLMLDFKQKLNTPELKYYFTIKQCIEVLEQFQHFFQQEQVNFFKWPISSSASLPVFYDQDGHNFEKEKKDQFEILNNSKFVFCKANTQGLQQMLDIFHKGYELQVPPYIQQIANITSYIGKQKEFLFTFKPLLQSTYVTKNNEVITKCKTKQELMELVAKKEQILDITMDMEMLFNDFIFAEMLITHSLVPFVFYDYAGHGEGGEMVIAIHLNYTDLKKYGMFYWNKTAMGYYHQSHQPNYIPIQLKIPWVLKSILNTNINSLKTNTTAEFIFMDAIAEEEKRLGVSNEIYSFPNNDMKINKQVDIEPHFNLIENYDTFNAIAEIFGHGKNS